jgi:hypothetical protein
MICEGSIPTEEQERVTRRFHFVEDFKAAAMDRATRAGSRRRLIVVRAVTRVHRAADEDRPAEDVIHMVPHSWARFFCGPSGVFPLRGSVSCGLMHVSYVVSCIQVPSLLQWPGSEVNVILFVPKGPQLPFSITSERNMGWEFDSARVDAFCNSGAGWFWSAAALHTINALAPSNEAQKDKPNYLITASLAVESAGSAGFQVW